MSVHNHPPYRPVCNERLIDGKLRGACMSEPPSAQHSAESEAAITALADKWKVEADKAARRSTSDPNAYLRMTIYERAERETRALLRPIPPTETYPSTVLDHLAGKTDDPAAVAEIERLRARVTPPAKSCGVCGAPDGKPCVRHTDEFNDEPGARKGDPTPWPHYFGGRATSPGEPQ